MFLAACIGSTLTLNSCADNSANEMIIEEVPSEIQNDITQSEVIENEVEVSNTVTDEQIAHYEKLLDLSSTETTISDCYISESFVYNDANYITVDFVNYRISTDPDQPEFETYELVNEIKTMRTFVVDQSYYDCAHTQIVELNTLIEKNNATLNLVFRIEVEDGIVTELYLDNCSG